MNDKKTVTEEGYALHLPLQRKPNPVDIHFDDLKVTHEKPNVIRYNEYYPFGLQASTSWTREGNDNDFLYNEASELNDASGWYDLAFRNYDAALGRFVQVDPLAYVDESSTPFAYGGNNPTYFNDPLGLQAIDPRGYTDGQLRTMYRNDRNEGGQYLILVNGLKITLIP